MQEKYGQLNRKKQSLKSELKKGGELDNPEGGTSNSLPTLALAKPFSVRTECIGHIINTTNPKSKEELEAKGNEDYVKKIHGECLVWLQESFATIARKSQPDSISINFTEDLGGLGLSTNGNVNFGERVVLKNVDSIVKIAPLWKECFHLSDDDDYLSDDPDAFNNKIDIRDRLLKLGIKSNDDLSEFVERVKKNVETKLVVARAEAIRMGTQTLNEINELITRGQTLDWSIIRNMSYISYSIDQK
ncbi:MAG: hypothetical protein H7230_03125 [Candidatus Parcubacteria bacterium]|nr:hypothetical protein [Candidatus Paceibacterota bacterium]